MNFFSRLMTFHYLKVASYIYLQSIKPATVAKSKQSSRGVPKTFTKFTGKHMCQAWKFNKKETLAQVFSCEYCEILKSTFFVEHFWWLPLVKLDPYL